MARIKIHPPRRAAGKSLPTQNPAAAALGHPSGGGARKTTANKANTAKPTRKSIYYDFDAITAPVYRGATTGPDRTRREKPGMRALREIKHYQKTTGLLAPRRPIHRLVRKVMKEVDIVVQETLRPDRIQKQALEILHEAGEAFIVHVMEATNLMAIHCNRVTIQPKDLQMAFRVTRLLAPYTDTIKEHLASVRT